MRVVVIGSRSLTMEVDGYIPEETTLIVSGGARGIDQAAERYAQRHGIPTLILKPDYERYGKRAPLVRDREVVQQADLVVALWDGQSRGTQYTLRYAQRLGIPIRIHHILPE